MSIVMVGRYNVETGCIVAGHHGHYAGTLLIDIAERFGYCDPETLQARAMYDDYNEFDKRYGDVWDDMLDDALEYLNSVTIKGVWDWWEGELFLYTVAEYERTMTEV